MRAYEAPAMTAPITGARTNSQTWLSAGPPTYQATPSERAGFTEVLVTGMLIRWIRVSASPVATGAKALFVRSSVAPRIT